MKHVAVDVAAECPSCAALVTVSVPVPFISAPPATVLPFCSDAESTLPPVDCIDRAKFPMTVLAVVEELKFIPVIAPAVDVGVGGAASSDGLLADRLLDKDNIGGMFANIEKILYREKFLSA